jgi:ABC-type multidrug transport system fused ATPase/permease subunit
LLFSCASGNIFVHRSLRENIIFGAEGVVDEQQLNAVIRDSYLEEVVRQMPAGLEQIVGERGVKLSGGERQRIAIARAMLKSAPILILDEATNSLDASSEYHVQLALQNLMRGRTSIIIAHKLNAIAGVDRIIVMQQGRIVEEGRHADLLEKKGEYFKLWQDQERQ